MSSITTVIRSFSNLINRRTQTAAEIAVAGDTTLEELSEEILPDIQDVADEMNIVSAEVNTNVSYVATMKTDAETAANISQASANFKGNWSGLSGSLSVPASVYHDGSMWMLLSYLTDVTAKEPGVASDFVIIEITPAALTSATSGTTLSAMAVNKITDSLEYDLPLASSVDLNGWVIIEKPDRYGDQTPQVNASGSDLIVDMDGTDSDGALILDYYGAEWVRLISNGSNTWTL